MSFADLSLFHSLLHHAADAVHIAKLSGELLYLNEKACQNLGIIEDNYQGKYVFDIEKLFKEPGVWESHVEFVRNEGPIRMRGNLINSDGKLLPIEASTSLVNLNNSEYIVAFIKDIKEQVEEEQLLQKTLEILRISVEISTCLLQTNPNIDPVFQSLQILGKGVKVDRVYIFQNIGDTKQDELRCRILKEWSSSAIEPRADNPIYQNIPYNKRWQKILESGNILQGSINDFPEDELAIYDEQSIKSLLVLPIEINDYFWGFIGFDACQEVKHYGDQEINLLKLTANLIGLYTERNQYTQELKSVVNEKEILLKEIHHRTKNNLALISGLLDLQENRPEKYTIESYSNNIRSRIQSISLIHEALSISKPFAELSFLQYLNLLIPRIEHSMSPILTITKHLQIENFNWIELNDAVSLGMIINEIISNMYRHVFLPGLGDTLIISTQHIPGKGVLIHLCDNGPGVKEEKLLNICSKSLGYSIIKGLCAQLKAELTVYSNRGLNYEILLPLKKIQ